MRETTENWTTASLESLEPRLLLSGDVAVSVDNGRLVVRGDEQANQVVVDQAGLEPGRLRITSGADATTINGSAEPIILDGITGDVLVRLGRGDDSIQLADLILDGNVSIAGGRGADTISLSDLDVAGDLRMAGGTRGAGSISLLDTSVGGDLVIRTLGRDDTVEIEHAEVGGSTRIETGRGDDRVTMEADDVRDTRSVFDGFVRLRTGGGDDKITIGRTHASTDRDSWPLRLGAGGEGLGVVLVA